MSGVFSIRGCQMGISLNDKGRKIVERGGHDDASDDDILLLELISRASGCSPDEYQTLFISLREQYGEDALKALRSGHVQFRARK